MLILLFTLFTIAPPPIPHFWPDPTLSPPALPPIPPPLTSPTAPPPSPLTPPAPPPLTFTPIAPFHSIITTTTTTTTPTSATTRHHTTPPPPPSRPPLAVLAVLGILTLTGGLAVVFAIAHYNRPRSEEENPERLSQPENSNGRVPEPYELSDVTVKPVSNRVADLPEPIKSPTPALGVSVYK